jgi:hypothetical protein
VNALKHGILTKGTPQIAAADNIREQVVHTIYRDEAGEYYDIKKSIEITLKDGTSRELFDVLTNVVNMWIDRLEVTTPPCQGARLIMTLPAGGSHTNV